MRNAHSHLDLHLLATPTRFTHLPPAELAAELKQLSSQAVAEQLMSIDFESAAEQLQSLDRMYFEMDGSFVWSGETVWSEATPLSGEESTQVSVDPVRWQIDGMIYDVGGRIQRVELKGSCPKANWRQLLSVLQWPDQPLIAYSIANATFEEIGELEERVWNRQASLSRNNTLD
jgi:hypothetical protein